MKLTIQIEGQEITFDVPEQVVEALQAIADRNGISLEDALAQAIVNENFLEEATANGGKLLIEKGDKLRRLEYA